MRYDLVFEGGGAKGIAFVGALEEFLPRHSFGRLVGTSAGAIVAAFLAAGYSPAEMLAALGEEVDGRPIFTTFLQRPTWRPRPTDPPARALLGGALALLPIYRHLASLTTQGGWYAADAFLAWLRAGLDRPTPSGKPRRFSHLTLGEFYAQTGRHLTLIGADITANQLLILNHNTAPACPLVMAVRISMSVPLLWQEVIWEEAWGPYLGESVTGHRMVDGGVISSFPLELLLSRDDLVGQWMGPLTENPALGFLIDEDRPVPNAPPPATRPFAFEDLFGLPLDGRLWALIDTMMQARDKLVLRAYRQLVVHLPAQGYGLTEFDMSAARREALLAGGRQATRDYFARIGGAEMGGGSNLWDQAEIDRAARRLFGDRP